MAVKKTKSSKVKETELVRVDKDICEKVKKHISVTGASIGWFYTNAAKEKLELISKQK